MLQMLRESGNVETRRMCLSWCEYSWSYAMIFIIVWPTQYGLLKTYKFCRCYCLSSCFQWSLWRPVISECAGQILTKFSA